MSFPALPAPAEGLPWSANIEHAYQIISTTFNLAIHVRAQEADSTRLRYHAEALTGDVIPLLAEMEIHAHQEGFPVPWIHRCAQLSSELVVQLLSASQSSSAR